MQSSRQDRIKPFARGIRLLQLLRAAVLFAENEKRIFRRGEVMARRPKKQRLNIFLMKDGVELADVVAADITNLDETQLRQGLNFEGLIYTKRTPANPPSWQSFVQAGAATRLGVLLNQSASCLLVIKTDGRVFAIAFGFGRHWIDDRHIVRRFGMIVTLNVVHPERIRSIDREEFDTIQRKTRSQTSVSSSISNFGLNIQRDLMRSVTGEPEEREFAAHVTGADNLIISASLTIYQLGSKCRDALRHFGSTRYRDRYSWIDNFVRITDPVIITELDGALVQSIRSGETGNIFLTPPDTLDTQEHRGFRFPNERKGAALHDDLRLEELFEVIDPSTISIEGLKQKKIREYRGDESSTPRKYSIYNAVIFECPRGGKLYALTTGEWFEIAQDHVTLVRDQIARIRDHDELQLISARNGEVEGEYNRRAAEASNNALALLDAQPVFYGGGHSQIEICDLLSLDRVFIHVKAKSKAATMSHLFAQGVNSAQAFRDARFRQLALERCPASHHEIFLNEPRASDFKITYAVITQADGDLRDVLPFFSKQSLANAAVALNNIGYEVRLKKIAVE